jgi:hypothetical protein
MQPKLALYRAVLPVLHLGCHCWSEHQRWIVKLTGNNYSSIFIIGPIFMIAALVMILGLQSGEANSKPVIESQE